MQPSPPQWSNWQDPAPSLQKQGWKKARTQYTDSGQVEHPSRNPHFSFLFVLQPETTEIKHLCLQTIPSPSSKLYLTMSVKTNTLKPGLWNEWACISTEVSLSWQLEDCSTSNVRHRDSTLMYARWTAKERTEEKKRQRHREWGAAPVTVRSLSTSRASITPCTAVRTQISLSLLFSHAKRCASW